MYTVLPPPQGWGFGARTLRCTPMFGVCLLSHPRLMWDSPPPPADPYSHMRDREPAGGSTVLEVRTRGPRGDAK